MAVTELGESMTTRPVAQPGVAVFLRLKSRLLGNSFRAAGWRKYVAVLGVLGGLWFSTVGFLAFMISGLVDARDGYTIAVLGGTGLVLGWLALPLLAFGVDETLDPTKFALLPVRRPVVLGGLLAAAMLGIPPIMTFLATQGLVLAAARRGGVGAAVAAFVGTVVGLVLCVVVSRAVTTAMATVLRSRRARDLGVIMFTVIAAGLGPLQMAGLSIARFVGPDRLATVAKVIVWTPLGAPYAVGFDVAAGDWPLAALRLAIAVLGIALLLAWWGARLPDAMIGAASASRRGTLTRTDQSGSGLVPMPLRSFPQGPVVVLVAREWRYWWRDPRRRSSLLSMLVIGLLMPVLFQRTTGALGLTGAVIVSTGMVTSLLANQFGFDGSAWSGNILIGVPGRVEITARMIAITAIVLPPLALSTVIIGAVTNDDRLLAALGVAALSYSAGTALAVVLSVVAPYALPETSNPFAMSTGTGGLRGFLSLATMLGSAVAGLPLTLLTSGLPGLLPFVVGLLLGVGVLIAGAVVAGGVLDERACTVLQAVSPRR